MKVDGSVHNVYVTPDGKFAVSGSVQTGVISVIDTKTDTLAWSLKMSAGIRPMIFDTNPDGSTRNIFVQLSNYHGIAVVDFATRKEVTRWELPASSRRAQGTRRTAGRAGARLRGDTGPEDAAGDQQVVRRDVRLLDPRLQADSARSSSAAIRSG